MTLREERAATVLDYLRDGKPLGLPATVQMGAVEGLIPVGLDNGNGHTKAALISPSGQVVTVVTPTIYRTAKEIRGGSRVTTYRVDSGAAFWIGGDAILDGDALPIGATAERLGDRRQREFLAAVLVEGLIAAGHQPGICNVLIGLAIPNQEIVLKDDGNRLGVAQDTRHAIKDHLFGKAFSVERTDTNGTTATWTVACSQILPQAQSIGTYLAWSRDPQGRDVDSGIEALSIIDIGTGDLQRTDIDTHPYRMTGEKLGRGTVVMARALASKLNMGLNDSQAMKALIDRTVLTSGMREAIGPTVDQIVDAEGQDIVARLLPIFQQNQRYVLFTGGGVLLAGLRTAIADRATAAGKVSPRNFAFVPESHALTLNATGAMLAVIYAALGHKGA